MNNIFPKGESFRDYADQVAVVESRIEFGQDQCGPTVGAIGTIRNSSPIGWKDIRFQVEFFDSEGNLVDAGQQSEYLSPHLPANEEIAFKVSFTRQFSEDKYMTHRIRVISAVDTRQRF